MLRCTLAFILVEEILTLIYEKIPLDILFLVKVDYSGDSVSLVILFD